MPSNDWIFVPSFSYAISLFILEIVPIDLLFGIILLQKLYYIFKSLQFFRDSSFGSHHRRQSQDNYLVLRAHSTFRFYPICDLNTNSFILNLRQRTGAISFWNLIFAPAGCPEKPQRNVLQIDTGLNIPQRFQRHEKSMLTNPIELRIKGIYWISKTIYYTMSCIYEPMYEIWTHIKWKFLSYVYYLVWQSRSMSSYFTYNWICEGDRYDQILLTIVSNVIQYFIHIELNRIQQFE